GVSTNGIGRPSPSPKIHPKGQRPGSSEPFSVGSGPKLPPTGPVVRALSMESTVNSGGPETSVDSFPSPSHPTWVTHGRVRNEIPHDDNCDANDPQCPVQTNASVAPVAELAALLRLPRLRAFHRLRSQKPARFALAPLQ